METPLLITVATGFSLLAIGFAAVLWGVEHKSHFGGQLTRLCFSLTALVAGAAFYLLFRESGFWLYQFLLLDGAAIGVLAGAYNLAKVVAQTRPSSAT